MIDLSVGLMCVRCVVDCGRYTVSQLWKWDGCNCPHGVRGNLCKHHVKGLLVKGFGDEVIKARFAKDRRVRGVPLPDARPQAGSSAGGPAIGSSTAASSEAQPLPLSVSESVKKIEDVCAKIMAEKSEASINSNAPEDPAQVAARLSKYVAMLEELQPILMSERSRGGQLPVSFDTMNDPISGPQKRMRCATEGKSRKKPNLSKESASQPQGQMPRTMPQFVKANNK